MQTQVNAGGQPGRGQDVAVLDLQHITPGGVMAGANRTLVRLEQALWSARRLSGRAELVSGRVAADRWTGRRSWQFMTVAHGSGVPGARDVTA
ncbi:hypothetical protein SBRY_90128 [Actinacidiphila bryophytorum]|uniref:Uncharacterized protein n=1 Tax=Actinacidiphila bryophytorum TaxID=1436133 RepID=A0A9W4H8F9_9ACTN|nr:hypothetical protein SBRY_90128 [Actinacidiphila bryophytorum]